jgi:hypothetical protein
MSDELSSILPSTAFLGAFALVAWFLTVSRSWADVNGMRARKAVEAAVVAVVAQTAHFAEEFLTGFHERFPALFGIPPMPSQFFVSFNIAWLVIWSLSVWGLASRCRPALFPLWFLGIACIGNGVAHPTFAILTGGYFPGLVTSLVVAALGVLLLRRLLRVTRATHDRPGAA